MSLLYEIQSAVLSPDADLGPTLLKVQLLAARLGSQPLADWVKHESEGYPAGLLVPDYRIIRIGYVANFAGPFGSGIQNAPIPSALIEQLAGKPWTNHEMRESVAAVDQLLASLGKGGEIHIDASNLIFKLQGQVYPDYNCISVVGKVPGQALANLKHSVKSRVLQLTIELEKSVPEATFITVGQSATASPESSRATTHIVQQIIYGNMTSISASGEARVSVGIQAGDADGIVRFLSEKGIPADDAKEFASIVASEKPVGAEPLGTKAQKWMGENLKKAISGTWGIGVAVATDLLKEAALKFYGLK